MARRAKTWDGKPLETLVNCADCGRVFDAGARRGRKPKYCSDACKQHAYRKSKSVTAQRLVSFIE